MNPFATGVDIPVSQMPIGMAFESGVSNNGTSQQFLGSLGKGIITALEDALVGAEDRASGAVRAPYADRTRDALRYLITEAIRSFEPAESTL